jgi:hypothetical protein
MNLPGSAGQQRRDLMLGGVVTSTGATQLLLPEAKSRSFFMFSNLSDTNMFLQFGSARAGAVTISGGIVTAVAIANAGFGYTVPPDIVLLGGGDGGAGGAFVGVGDSGYPAPGDAAMTWARTANMASQRPAKVRCTLSGNAVNAIVVDDMGAGYKVAPLAVIRNSPLDPVGAAIASATDGFLIAANGGSIYLNGTFCPTDPISLFCASGSKVGRYAWAP